MKSTANSLQSRKVQAQTTQPQHYPKAPTPPPHQGDTRSELKTVVVTILVTLGFCLAILRYLDILSTGAWPDSEHVSFIKSQSDKDALFSRAKSQEDKAFVLVFYSESCMACRRMKRHYLRCAAEIKDVSFYAAQVGSGQNRDLVKEFAPMFVPAVFVVRPAAGKETRTLYRGKSDSRELAKFIRSVLAGEYRESAGMLDRATRQ